MSNQAKDWQNGQYTVRIKGNLVEVDTIQPIKKESPFGIVTVQKRYVATARCAPEDEFSLSMGVALAMDRLNKQLDEANNKTIKVGDKVKIKDEGLSYTTYTDWIKKNIDDIGLAACFAYEQIPEADDTVYIVKAIAPWDIKYAEDKSKKLAYIQRYFEYYGGKVSDDEVCHLMRVDGLEKVYG